MSIVADIFLWVSFLSQDAKDRADDSLLEFHRDSAPSGVDQDTYTFDDQADDQDFQEHTRLALLLYVCDSHT